MFSYQKQMRMIILFLTILIFLGLTVVSVNMERITLRNGQDFFFISKSADTWEFRFLGTSLVLNKEVIKSQLARLGLFKNGQEAGYPIK